jgi:acid phosphatase class B
MFRLSIYNSILIGLVITTLSYGQLGQLRVGFDIDDTTLYSEEGFVIAPRTVDGEIDYGWINTHDKEYSLLIKPVATLIEYFRVHGHEVFFITARPGINGDDLATFLTTTLNFDVCVDSNLFFSPKENYKDFRYTTKHLLMRKLDLDIYYGDSDTDIIAALKANVHPVRIIRSAESIKEYGGNYFGDTNKGDTAKAPFNKSDLEQFYKANVGIFGESIYPINWEPEN